MVEMQKAPFSRGAEEMLQTEDTEIDLMELFYVLMDKLAFLIAFALLGALLSAGYTMKFITPTYEATSKLYVTNARDSVINLSDLEIGSYLASDYQEVFKTWEVHRTVIENLKLSYTQEQLEKMLYIFNPNGTRILYITAKSSDPKEAVTIANEYAAVASKYISETMATEEPNVLSAAVLPTKPVAPNKTQNILLGLVTGGLIAVGIVIARFIADDRIKTPDDVRKYSGMAVLALVPAVAGVGSRKASRKKVNRRTRT